MSNNLGKNMESIILNGIKYVKESSETSKKICILQRGWVMVGDFKRDGNDCTLTNASVIRVWGTTKGLGEIALNGPTKDTKLDLCGTARFDYLTTIAILYCSEKWS
jgi:hypothetical protein